MGGLVRGSRSRARGPVLGAALCDHKCIGVKRPRGIDERTRGSGLRENVVSNIVRPIPGPSRESQTNVRSHSGIPSS